MRLQVADTPALRVAARSCEAEVFLEAFGNTAEQLAVEYGPYEDQSVFLVVLDDTDAVVGAARLVLHGPAGLKTVNDAADWPWHVDTRDALRQHGVDLDRMFDVATLGVLPASRGKMTTAAALFWGCVNFAPANDYDGAVAIMDDGILRVFASISVPWLPIPGCNPAPYLGSPSSLPVYQTYEGLMAAADDAGLGDMWRRGAGIAVDLPAIDQLRIRVPAAA